MCPSVVVELKQKYATINALRDVEICSNVVKADQARLQVILDAAERGETIDPAEGMDLVLQSSEDFYQASLRLYDYASEQKRKLARIMAMRDFAKEKQSQL
jgi:hypothetical protein